MEILPETFAQARIDELRPHPRNPRQGDVGAIHTSIEQNGFYGAVVAQKSTGYILAGNHRYLAAKHAGAPTIPTLWVDVDDARALRILLADNRTADLAAYDNQGLLAVLQEVLTDGGLGGTGYDTDDLEALLKEVAGEDPHTDMVQGSKLDARVLHEVSVTVATMEERNALVESLRAAGWTPSARVVHPKADAA